MIHPWGNNRRYNSYTNWCKNTFGYRIQKVSVNAGFTCPNRDGTKGVNGCIFCNNNAFNPPSTYSEVSEPLVNQIDKGLKFVKGRYKKPAKYIAYFQSYSNTYGNIDQLKKKYEEALSHPEIIGLAIGTRPDCIDEEKLTYLKKLSKKYFISIEYGIESCYDKTLKYVNRGHTFEDTLKALGLTAKFELHTVAHFILGLPGESKTEIVKQAEIISSLPINSVKLHQLQVVKDTKLAEEYLSAPEKFRFFELPEYIDLIIDFLEKLNPKIAIERLSGEVPPKYNLGKPWEGNLRSDQIIQLIERRLEERNTWQGKLFSESL